jgi:hypothetical protein
VFVSTADEYRGHAASCLQAAKLALREDVKLVLLSMAQHWNEAAARIERKALQLADGGAPDDRLPGA